MTKPLVSRTALRSFINVVFKHADPGTYVFLRAFGNDNRPYGNWQRIKLHERDRDKLIGAAIKLAEQCAIGEPEHPVFCPPIATFRKGNGARQHSESS